MDGKITTDKSNLPEAPASVTYSITSRDGYNALFTVRDTDGIHLLQTMSIIEDKLKALLYIPQVKPVFGQKKEIEYVPDKKCLKCGGRLKIIHAKNGGTYWSCENGKYDYLTKQKTGCDFFTSPDNYGKTFNKENPYVDKTGHEWDGEWSEPQ